MFSVCTKILIVLMIGLVSLIVSSVQCYPYWCFDLQDIFRRNARLCPQAMRIDVGFWVVIYTCIIQIDLKWRIESSSVRDRQTEKEREMQRDKDTER